MAGEFSNQFLVSVTVDRLSEVEKLYNALVKLKELAAAPIKPIQVEFGQATQQAEKLGTAMRRTKRAVEEMGAAGGSAQNMVKGMEASARQAAEAARYAERMLKAFNEAGRAAATLAKTTGQAANQAAAFVAAMERARTAAPLYHPPGAPPLGPYDPSAAAAAIRNRYGISTGPAQAYPSLFDKLTPGPRGSYRNIVEGLTAGAYYRGPETPPPDPLDRLTNRGRSAGSNRNLAEGLTVGARYRPPTSDDEIYKDAVSKSGAFQQFSNKFKQLTYYALAGGVIFGIATSIRAVSREIVTLEAELARIQGFFDDKSLNSRLQIERGAIQAAKDYGEALSEVVRVTKFFAQAGFGPQEAIEQTRASLAASAALGIPAEEAAQTAISVQAVTGGRVSSREIFERIATIDAQFAVNANDLNQAVQRVGAFVSQLQPRAQGIVDALDLVIGATTQIVQTTRVSGNQAANALKFIVARLTAPEIATKLQGTFGIRLAQNEAGTELRPLQEILQEIAETYQRLKTTDTVKAQQLLATVAGTRQIGLATALFDDFNKAMEIASESATAYGALQARVNLQLDTVEKQLRIFGVSFISYFNSLLKQTGVVDATKAVLSGGSSLLGKAEKDRFGAVGAFVGGVLLTNAAVQTFKGLGRVTSLLKAAETSPRILTKGFFNVLGTGANATTGLAGIANLFKNGSGLNAFQKIIATITTLFGSLTPFVVVGALLAFGAVIKSFIDSKSKFDTIRRVTSAEIDTTDFGRELSTTTGTLGITNSKLLVRVNEAIDTAREGLIQLGVDEAKKKQPEPGIAAFADPAYVDRLLNNQTKNVFFRKPFEELFGRALLSRLDPEGVLQLTGAKLPDTGITNEQVALAQQILKQTIQYEQAPRVATESTRQQELSNLLSKVTIDDVVSGLTRRRVRPVQGRGGGTVEDTRLSDALTSAFGAFAPDLENFRVKLNEAGDTITGFQGVMQGMTEDTATWAQGLDAFFIKYFTPEGGLGASVVDFNRTQLRNQYITTLRTDTKDGPVLASGKRAGERAGQIILEIAQSAIDELFKQEVRRSSPEGRRLQEIAKALQQAGPGYAAKISRDIQLIATARDRIGEAIADFAKKMLEIEAVAPIFARVGFAFDPLTEKLGTIQGFLRTVGGLPGQIEGDLLGLRLKESQIAALIAGKTPEEILGYSPDEGEFQDEEDEFGPKREDVRAFLISPTGKAALERIQFQIRELSTFLDAFRTNKELLKYARPEEVQTIQRVFGELGTKNFKVTDIKTVLDIAERLGNTLLDDLTTRKLENLEIDRKYAKLQREATLQTKLQEIQSEVTIANAARTGRPFATVGPQLQSILARRRDAEIQAARAYNQEREKLEKSGLLDKNRSEFEEQLKKLQDTFQGAVGEAYNEAIVQMESLLTKEKTAILDDTQSRIRELISSGTAGIKDALKDTALLFGQGSNTLNDLGRAVLKPIAATIQGNLVDNLVDGLVGPGGLFEKQAGAFFGQSEKDRERLRVKQLQYEATYQGTYDALKDRGIGQDVPGGGSPDGAKFNPASRLLGGVGALAFLPFLAASLRVPQGPLASYASSGVPGILQGALSPTGPNASGVPEAEKKRLERLRTNDLKRNALKLAGIYAGTLLGGAIGGKGVNSYAGEGAGIGSALGGLLGPVGGIAGGLLGGLFGGFFGKSAPKQIRQPQVLELIERNTRQAAAALENQNRNLFNLDSRLLNVPSSFLLPGYRPQEANATVTNTYQFNITGNNPQEIALEVERVIRAQEGRQGSFTPVRRGI